jgi:hypothetical protein
VKENLKPCVYKLRERNIKKRGRVLFVERSGELFVQARIRLRITGSEGKPSLNRAISQYE